MGNLFYDEPRIEGKFKAGDRVRITGGLVNMGKIATFIEYTGSDRSSMAYSAFDGPNPECRVRRTDGYGLYFAESDLELIAVQETQHEQPAAEPSHIADAATPYVTFGPAILVDRTPDQRFTGRAVRVIGRTQD